MNRSDFSFELPNELIAQNPLPLRDRSRLLVMDKHSGQKEHRQFFNVTEYLKPGDCLVLNDSKVIPARLYNGKVEILLHERLDDGSWTALAKPGKKARPGDTLLFGDGRLEVHIKEIGEGGLRLVTLVHEGQLEPLLDEIGLMPLPHYIHTQLNTKEEKGRYQTVYAKHDGSVAAPTAGLHFTPELLEQIQAGGVSTAKVTLHVGLGTFRPVKVENITEHHMHSEFFEIKEDQAAIINAAKRRGGRVIAVGTTSCRTLESRAGEDGTVEPGAGHTGIFIYPGYKFKAVDGLLTNFHLPESTLLMLVSALAGRENVLAAYKEAIEMGYRFYSFGDAMMIN
jgi:S-adenosylmethionine:tRNA ribosyltransferase-isomerase